MLSNKEWALRWVLKLKQGTYKKTTGTLKIGEGQKASYCCLGVGCQITRINYEDHPYQRFQKKVGLKDNHGTWADFTDSLVYLNDNVYLDDKDHKNIYKEMKKLKFSMFIPEVAQYLNENT